MQEEQVAQGAGNQQVIAVLNLLQEQVFVSSMTISPLLRASSDSSSSK
jgi:hypothetical protein